MGVALIAPAAEKREVVALGAESNFGYADRSRNLRDLCERARVIRL
jgi:hypothetical protein